MVFGGPGLRIYIWIESRTIYCNMKFEGRLCGFGRFRQGWDSGFGCQVSGVRIRTLVLKPETLKIDYLYQKETMLFYAMLF